MPIRGMQCFIRVQYVVENTLLRLSCQRTVKQCALTAGVNDTAIDPAAYVELIVEDDLKRYLQAVTRYELPEEMR